MSKAVWIGKVLIWIVVIVAIAFGFVMGTMYLWNWLVPDLFNGPVINFWQALGLLVLSKILFGFGGKGGHHKKYSPGPWKNYWRSKWNTMSPEDREHFKQKMKDKWCYTGEKASTSESGTSNG